MRSIFVDVILLLSVVAIAQACTEEKALLQRELYHVFREAVSQLPLALSIFLYSRN